MLWLILTFNLWTTWNIANLLWPWPFEVWTLVLRVTCWLMMFNINGLCTTIWWKNFSRKLELDSRSDSTSRHNSIEYEWERWISRFEAMLRSMYWSSATVHLETELSGKHTFSWESTGAGHNPSDSELKMVCEWERESTFNQRPRS